MDETDNQVQGSAADEQEKELQAKLDKKRAELATLQAGREKARRRAEIEEEIAVTERKCREEAALSAAEAKYGPLGTRWAAMETLGGVVILTRGDGIKVRIWADKHGANPSVQACRELVRPNVQYPAIEEFDEMVKEMPMVLVAAAGKLLELSGVGAKELGGK
ncbi:hypothetical protein WME76_02290 [Sorangium sp. So ce119]|uniref:hypothetical protein n=1 Tax=Sorangium sp. So ce119 TaxID=3133279 RepID=UPI003F5E8D83